MIECECGAKEHKRGGSENEKTVHKWIHLGKNIFSEMKMIVIKRPQNGGQKKTQSAIGGLK
jgi:hypothetical protein